MKKEFICVKPKSASAKHDFVDLMHELHSCVVTKREHGKVSLSSISNHYDFDIYEGGDDNWEIIK